VSLKERGRVLGTFLAREGNHLTSVTSDLPPVPRATDSELLELMAAGDREAFGALFRRYQTLVYRFARQMTGSKEAAEDVTQEVFIALAENAGRYDVDLGSLGTYLYGIARNLVRQRYKRAKIEANVVPLEDGASASLAITSNPVDDLARAERIRALRHAILLLPVRYREVIVLCELNDLPYEQAARIVGCPVGTIRSRLSRAKMMLVERCRRLARTETAKGTHKVQGQCLKLIINGD
jgi:RNA polymerase sigma-70 factor, ECF subfamily